ncbi:MAG: hypothetical protein E7223_03885 [Clostridiales bacterium]|nr:hypothetical protein [Clostridiales bacterium]
MITTNGHELKEQDFTYPMESEVYHLNGRQIVKPSSFLLLFSRIAETHLETFEANFSRLSKFGYSWALISISIDVERPFGACVPLVGQTWASARKGPYFRREMRFADPEGNVYFRGSTYSVIIDLESRSVYRKKELPLPIPEETPEFCTESISPHFRETLDFEEVAVRTVNPSEIDALGHVNNCRYGDYAFDAMTAEERELLSGLRHMDVYFISEMREGDRFAMEKAWLPEEKRLVVRGHNLTKDDISFVLDFRF